HRRPGQPVCHGALGTVSVAQAVCCPPSTPVQTPARKPPFGLKFFRGHGVVAAICITPACSFPGGTMRRLVFSTLGPWAERREDRASAAGFASATAWSARPIQRRRPAVMANVGALAQPIITRAPRWACSARSGPNGGSDYGW